MSGGTVPCLNPSLCRVSYHLPGTYARCSAHNTYPRSRISGETVIWNVRMNSAPPLLSSSSWSPPIRDEYDSSRLSAMKLHCERQHSDQVRLLLSEGDEVHAHIDVVALPDNRLWAVGRYNSDHGEAPKGVQSELQNRVLRAFPGWSLVSCPAEMSEDAVAFREAYLERNPETVWELDPDLDSDEGSSDRVRLTSDEIQSLIPDTAKQWFFNPNAR